MKRNVTDEMLIERCNAEAKHAETKAAGFQLYDLEGFALLFERAALFWSNLGFSVMTGLPLMREQEFVVTFLRKEMSGDHGVWNVDKHSRKRVTA